MPKKQKYEREKAVMKAKDLIKNPTNYTKATSYGCTAYINNISFSKDTGEIGFPSMKKRLPKKHCMTAIIPLSQVKKNFLIKKSEISIKVYGK